MARLIKTDTPAKKRHEYMRSSAEALRLLAQKSSFDEEAKDMCAFLVFNLRGIYRTIDESAQVWDERNYWKKAEKLRHDWRWSRIAADELQGYILADRWSEVPTFLLSLLPHFNSISVTAVTRDSDWWCGALRALKKETSE